MRHAELTTHDGRKVGIPRDAALLIMASKGVEDHPKAKALIRFSIGFGQYHSVFVRDAYKHLLGLFPTARGGAPWAHATSKEGLDLVFPQNTISYWEELADKGGTRVILMVEDQQVVLDLKDSVSQVRSWLQVPGEEAAEAAA